MNIKFKISFYLCLLLTYDIYAQSTPQQVSQETYISRESSFSINDNFKALFLREVLEQGTRQNYDQKIRNYQNEILELNWKDTKEEFWIPQLKLGFEIEPHRVLHLRNGSENRVTGTDKRPYGNINLDLGEYTVFNWGKDYLQFLNNKETYQRSKESLKEDQRDLKHQLIKEYFSLLTQKKIERIKRSQLRHASFIYRLAKEKVSLKKLSKQDYYLARAEYLKAQTEYHQSKNSLALAEEVLASSIDDPIGTRYLVTEKMNYKKILISVNESISLSKKYNRKMRDNSALVKNAIRSSEIKNKENLPLPKFTIDFGAYNGLFGKSKGGIAYNNSANHNLEVVATINATWSLTGKGGLLNSRDVKRAQLEKIMAFNMKKQSYRLAQAQIQAHFKNLEHYENQVTILEARIITLQKSFDTILENYTSKKARYFDFHHALNNLVAAEVLMAKTKLNHLHTKINLATTIGIEDFPGSNFELLATKLEAK